MVTIIEHEKYGPVLFNTETQEYKYMPEEERVFFVRDGKYTRYFDNINMFLNSIANIGVIPVVCSNIGHKGRRTFIEVIDWDNYNYKLFNVEMINYKWTKNCIDYMKSNKVYFILVQKNKYALNDFILLSKLEIKKRESY